MSVADYNANFDSREAFTDAEEEAYRERQLAHFDGLDSDEVCDPDEGEDEIVFPDDEDDFPDRYDDRLGDLDGDDDDEGDGRGQDYLYEDWASQWDDD